MIMMITTVKDIVRSFRHEYGNDTMQYNIDNMKTKHIHLIDGNCCNIGNIMFQ